MASNVKKMNIDGELYVSLEDLLDYFCEEYGQSYSEELHSGWDETAEDILVALNNEGHYDLAEKFKLHWVSKRFPWAFKEISEGS